MLNEPVHQLENGRWQGYSCLKCGKERTYTTKIHAKNSANSMCGKCSHNTDSYKAIGQARTIDLIGNIFGHVRVIAREGSTESGLATWRCICLACNREFTTKGINLRYGYTDNCGCLTAKKCSIGAGRAAFNAVLCNYKRHAKKRGIDWELDDSQFAFLISQPCIYCGAVGSNYSYSEARKNYGGIYYNGIDRIVSQRGYIIGNVGPCCIQCNWAKREMTTRKFSFWICQVYGNSGNSGELWNRWATTIRLITHELSHLCDRDNG